MSSDLLGHVIAFSSLGVLSVTQELAGAVLSDVEGAEPDLVAEETLCLVATTTARAAAVGLRAAPEAGDPVVDVLENLPYVYRDYLLGGELLDRSDPSIADAADDVFRRLERKHEFYRVHFPENQFPGEKVLTEKMALWMGRISPPKLPEMPSERLRKLELVAPLLTHLKLVLAYCRKSSNGS
ncbi:MAG: hypothetical protein WD021_03430 [Rhodothermales bacterium]